MRKNKSIGVFLLAILFLLPFGNYANAQGSDYVGVEQGDQYTWNVEVEFEFVEDLIENVRDVIVDLQTNIDLGGLESMTVEEIYEEIAHTYLSNALPVGWEGYNISTLIPIVIEDYIGRFNSTILSGMIPSNWQALNFSDFYDLVFDGLNSGLPPGWETNPLPELFEMLINELNSTIFYGLIPAGWEELTLEELAENLLGVYAPGMWESIVLQMMLDNLMLIGLTPEMVDYISTYTLSDLLNELVASFPPEITTLNATELFDMIFFGLNQTIPGGMESESMSNVIYFLNLQINSTLPLGYDSLSVAELLQFAIDEIVNMTIPLEFQGKTIQEIVDLSLTEVLNTFDNDIMPAWDAFYTEMDGLDLLSYEVGLRAVIDHVGSEIQPYTGGPVGVPIEMDLLYSLDFENWIEISELLPPGYSLSPFTPLVIFSLMGFTLDTVDPLIVDPSSYSDPQIALIDQLILSGPLIVANNYDWETIETETTIATTGNPDSIEISVAWNAKGVLQKAFIKADGDIAAIFTLSGEGGVSEIIPGYGIPIIVGFIGLTIIAIILYGKRRNRIIK